MENQGGFEPKSFWMTTRDYAPGPALAGDLDVDVVVVGGGFTGLSTAYHLKQMRPGLSVALVEGEIIGFGASGRNGGFSMTLFGLTMGITALRFGRARAREAHLYMERAVDLLADLVSRLSLDCDYEHPGFLRVATSPRYEKRILHEMDLAHSLGITGIEWLDRDQTRAQVNSDKYLGAWWEPRCGILNPAKLSWAWRDVIQGQGVSVFENSPATAIQLTPGGVRVTTPGGTVSAKKAVLATNAWSHLVPGLARKQTPAWTHIVLTEPLDESRLSSIGWKNRQGVEDARNLVHYYRLTADNRLLMGGRDVTLSYGRNMDRDRNEAVFQGLAADVSDLFPSLRGVRYTHQWGGPVSVTLDMAPAMGTAAGGRIVYSLGCMGHGVSLTHLNGAVAADLVEERKTDLTDVFFVNRKTLPWPPEPVRALASAAVLAAMRLEDRFTD
ncbi:MAG: FAD-dependent oxidoreductase [Pseudomonadota bacterium]